MAKRVKEFSYYRPLVDMVRVWSAMPILLTRWLWLVSGCGRIAPIIMSPIAARKHLLRLAAKHKYP